MKTEIDISPKPETSPPVPSFLPLRWHRVYFKPVPVFLDVYVPDIDEAERQARLDWIEIAETPIVDSIELLEEGKCQNPRKCINKIKEENGRE